MTPDERQECAREIAYPFGTLGVLAIPLEDAIDLLERVERQVVEALTARTESHGQPCYYCSQPIDNTAANPGQWGIPLCHADDPGTVKWHHIACVSQRLHENSGAWKAEIERQAKIEALKWVLRNCPVSSYVVHHTNLEAELARLAKEEKDAT